MLSKEIIQTNKAAFINALKQVNRDGIDDLIDWLSNDTDFFTAPASCHHHQNYEGGLCEHSLDVYLKLRKLFEDFDPEYLQTNYESVIIAGLLHDISKANHYEQYSRNVNTGKKDEKGRDIWIQVPDYKVLDSSQRLIYGNHEETSEFIVRNFISLKIEESAAIINHHAGMGFDSSKTDIGVIYKQYSLALMLHLADMLSAFISDHE